MRLDRSRSLILAALAGIGAAVSCSGATASGADPAPQTQAAVPLKLVVFITVDQFRGDYPTKYGPELKRGLKRLTEGGAWFTNGFQDHAITETAPGHASTMSGRFPSSTGIASNSIGVVDRNFTLIAADRRENAASPHRFQGTTLFDWLFAKNKRARALSVSMKDRGAILPIGHSKQDVYWYSNNGSFVTSDYYRAYLPDWVTAFNARKIPFKYTGSAWRLSRDTLIYKEPDEVAHENRQVPTDNLFPHAFPTNNDAVIYLKSTPAMDSLTALFALEGLRQTGIGRGTHTDVMAVSFSATDYIGHTWGPDSREAHENMLRLDETLGWFIDSLYKLRDSASIVIAMTGDHGVSPIPELARERGEATGDQGLRVSLRQQVLDVQTRLAARGVSPDAFLYDGELVGIDRAAVTRGKLNPDSVLNAFAAAARQVRGVARVDWVKDLRKADFAADPIARRWAHQVPEGLNADLAITLTRYSYWSANATSTHGTPYDQDAWVPILFYGAGVKTGKYTTFARTVDMAPTLAAIVNVKPLEKLDGVPLTEAIKP